MSTAITSEPRRRERFRAAEREMSTHVVESTTGAMGSDLRLAAIFRGQPPSEASPHDAELGASLRRLFEDGQRAFPELALPAERFASHLGARAPAGDLPTAARATDLYLACACTAQIRGAHEAFDRAHLRHLGVYLARMRLPAAFLDDLRQSLREKLFVGRDGSSPRIAEYDGRGALASWMRVVAVRGAIDLRRRSTAVREEALRADEPVTGDLEADYLKRRYRQAFNAAFRGAVAALGREPRALLQLHFIDGLTLDQLAAKVGVHRATVARRIAAARDAVTEEARRRIRGELGVGASELASLTGVMRSQIELSLTGLLQQG